jgi:hypothetical protein
VYLLRFIDPPFPEVNITLISQLGGGTALGVWVNPQDVPEDALPDRFGTEGNEFEYNLADGVWQYNLKTKNHTAAGTYTITMVSGNESEYMIDLTCAAAFGRED